MKLELLGSIDEIEPAIWDACAGEGDPFLSHAFLAAMERSGSASTETGWRPLHMVLEDAGEIVAVAPAYGKAHSWGEYVFDHAWADAYERAGGDYFPKLLGAVPFTPAPGRRLLTRPDRADARAALAIGARQITEQLGWSGAHVNFCAPSEAELLEAHGYLRRTGLQYHWNNRGYRSFEDFLAALRSSKRKTIAKERRRALESGVEIETLTGEALTAERLAAFYPFYRATIDKRIWGQAYLTPEFFEILGETFRSRVVLVLASRDGAPVAGALNLLGEDALYGRLWGALEDCEFLHFECCYYRAIDFAIEREIPRVEAGAQGTHKLLRGYEPTPTHSAHHLAHPGLRSAVARFLAAERQAIDAEIEGCKEALPYKREG